jgi:8-hydroxy-5-deazaflavin:NADPH oxidoreductase
MQVGIIGSGKVGKALGSWFAAAGFSVLFTSRDQEHAKKAAQSAGHNSKATTITDLVRDCEVMLLTVPYDEVGKVLGPVRAALADKTLVDVTNPITPDRRRLIVGHTTSGAEEIARQCPTANVVKAFNAVFAEVYQSQNAQIERHAITIFFAGDNAGAKAEVRELIVRLGFDAVDAGPLENARYLEPLSMLNIQLGRFLGLGTQIGFSLLKTSGTARKL